MLQPKLTSQSRHCSTTLAFWLMGALNNMPYVVMLAGAKSISEGGTALVFLANISPGLLVKLSSPYWFEKVSYERRIMSSSILMTLSFLLVATFGLLRDIDKLNDGSNNYDDNDGNFEGNNNNSNNDGVDLYLVMQLFGVACSSAQGSLGEATLLALSGKVDSMNEDHQDNHPEGTTSILANQDHSIEDDEHEDMNISTNSDGMQQTSESKSWSITAFSSGTGLAGVLGFAYVILLTDVLHIPLTIALYVAMIFPLLYYTIYIRHIHQYTILEHANDNHETLNEAPVGISHEIVSEMNHIQQTNADDLTSNALFDMSENEGEELFSDNPTQLKLSFEMEQKAKASMGDNGFIKSLSTVERLKLTLSLWPFMLPLFVVYASEYALQSGVWTSMGFPVDDEKARISFYMKSNWFYQVGVFVSRSSGAFCIAPMWILWLMPILQSMNLIVFYLIATYHFWYNNILLIGCFYVGLLGGGVYVNGYMRVNKDLPVSIREFALSTVSIADSLGIVFADFSGLFIQSCLYKSNGINGSVVQCPV